MHTLVIKRDDLIAQQVIDLIAYHTKTAREQTAPGSAHAMDIEQLRHSGIMFWTAWSGDALCGMGALKIIGDHHAELKSFHTAAAFRRTGIGARLLDHIISEARTMGVTRLSLETGSWPYFKPAVALYQAHGFVETGPFGDYKADPNSLFLTRSI